MILQGTGGKIMLLGVGTVAGKSSPVPSVVVVPVGFPSAPGQVKITVVAVTSQPIPVPRPGLKILTVYLTVWPFTTFPAGFCSMESVRRFALQLEGERWASACPPLTPD